MTTTIFPWLDVEYWETRQSLGAEEEASIAALAKSMYQLKGEAIRFTRRRAADAAIDFLEGIGDQKSVENVLKLLYEMKDWDRLAARCAKVVPGTMKPDNLNFYKAAALWRLGRFDEAWRLFQSIEKPLPLSREKVKSRFLDDYLALQGRADTSLIVRDLFEGNRDDLIHDLSAYYFQLSGFDFNPAELSGLLDAIHGACSALSKFDAEELSPRLYPSTDDVDARDLVFVCGFGWSGSGAVTDFLLGSRDVVLASERELIWTQGRSTVRLSSIRDVIQASSFKLHVVKKFFLSGVLGVALPDESDGYSVKQDRSVFRNSIIGCLMEASVSPVQVTQFIKGFFLALANVESLKEFLAALSKFAISVIRMCAGDAKTILINNGIMAPFIGLANLFPGAKFVVVKRNSLDQFCSRQLEYYAQESVSDYLKVMRRGIRWFREGFATLEDVDRVIAISFESFVEDETVRRAIADRIGVALDGDLRRFDPSVSRKNIGIHEAWPNSEDIEEVRAAALDHEYGDVVFL